MRTFSLITILFSLLCLLNQTAAQTCFLNLGPNNNFSGYRVPSLGLESAACSLESEMGSFSPDFNIIGAATYLYKSVTPLGNLASIEEIKANADATLPFYLLFINESESELLFKDIHVYVKLPETGFFSCLSVEDRETLRYLVEQSTKNKYAEQNNSYLHYDEALIAGIDRLTQIVRYYKSCCITPSGSCSLCPDSSRAYELMAYFEGHCFKKLPVKIVAGVTSAKPQQEGSAKLTSYGSIQNDTEKEVEFQEGISGRMDAAINVLFGSDYFEGISGLKGFVSANSSFCSEGVLEETETDYNEAQREIALWAHLWENPDPDGQDYLYIGSRVFSTTLCGSGRVPDLAGKLDEALAFNDHEYVSKFIQCAVVILAEASTVCEHTRSEDLENYFEPGNLPILEYFCPNAGLEERYYLSVAGAPIKLPMTVAPVFNYDGQLELQGGCPFDSRALVGFFAGNGKWVGCHTPSENNQTPCSHSGYYNYVLKPQRYRALEPEDLGAQDFQIFLGRRTEEFYILESAHNYHPVRVNEYASGPILPNFGYINAGGELPLDLAFHAPTVKEIRDCFYKVISSKNKLTNGTLFKVPNPDGSTFTYYWCKTKFIGDPEDGVYENVWHRFDCASGGYIPIENPFINNGEIDSEAYSWVASTMFWMSGESDEMALWLNQSHFSELNELAEASHNTLDVIGMVCPVGDLVNSVLYFCQGEYGKSCLAAIGAIPLIGETVSGLRKLRFATNAPLPPTSGMSNLSDLKFMQFPCIIGVNRPEDEATSKMLAKSVRKCPPVNISKIEQASSTHLDDTQWQKFAKEVMETATSTGDEAIKAAEIARACESNPLVMRAWKYADLAQMADLKKDAKKLEMLAADLDKSNNLRLAFEGNAGLVKAWEKSVQGGLVQMRKNTSFLGTLSKYIDGPLIRKFPNLLDVHEEAVIRHYTTPGGYYNLNAALRGEIDMTDELAEYASTLNSALGKLPDHAGVTYRGVGPVEGNFLKSLGDGDTFPVKDFYSTSLDEEIAHIFRERNGGDVLVTVTGAKGKKISDISDADFEGELLFMTQSKFRKKAEFPGTDPNTGDPITEILIEQID